MQLEREPTDIPNMRAAPAKLRRDDPLSLKLAAVRDNRCEASFKRLYEFYAPRLCAFLRQKGADERISQEIMQEAMTRVWLKAKFFDEHKANASTWVFTIARNLFIDHARKRRRAELDMNDPLLVAKPEPAPDAGIDAEDRNRMLMDAIEQLPDEQAVVLRLIYLGGMKQQAVADQLAIPLNTVKSRLRLALEKMRRQMEHA